MKIIAEDRFDPASRALSYIVTKMIKNNGFPLRVFKTIFEACVLSVLLYGSEVTWGFNDMQSSKNIFHRALRCFLGVGKSTSLAGMKMEMGLIEPMSHCHIRMVRYFLRVKSLSKDNLARRIFEWDYTFHYCTHVLFEALYIILFFSYYITNVNN